MQKLIAHCITKDLIHRYSKILLFFSEILQNIKKYFKTHFNIPLTKKSVLHGELGQLQET